MLPGLRRELGSALPVRFRSGASVRARVASPFRGLDLDGDKLDNLDEWYAARGTRYGRAVPRGTRGNVRVGTRARDVGRKGRFFGAKQAGLMLPGGLRGGAERSQRGCPFGVKSGCMCLLRARWKGSELVHRICFKHLPTHADPAQTAYTGPSSTGSRVHRVRCAMQNVTALGPKNPWTANLLSALGIMHFNNEEIKETFDTLVGSLGFVVILFVFYFPYGKSNPCKPPLCWEICCLYFSGSRFRRTSKALGKSCPRFASLRCSRPPMALNRCPRRWVYL